MKDPTFDLKTPFKEKNPFEFERRAYLERRVGQEPGWEGGKNRRRGKERRQVRGRSDAGLPSIWNVFVVAFSVLFLLTLLIIWILI